MRSTVQKWGNCAAVRIPAAILQSIRLELDDAVEVRVEAGRIVIEPVRQRRYDLDEMLKGITATNRHEPIDFGAAAGKEVS